MNNIPTYLKPFDKLCKNLMGKHSAYKIFDDFLHLVICGLSYGKMEQKRARILAAYEYQEQETLWKMFECLASMYGEARKARGWADLLGIYYEYLSSQGHKQDFGQFFTPPSICELSASMIIGDDTPIQKTIYDPACGSGRLLLCIHARFPHNYFVASDLDFTCVMMTAVNMCLHGACGEVVWKDALDSNDSRRVFRFGYAEIWGVCLPSVWEVALENVPAI